jgi:hypothetical protein
VNQNTLQIGIDCPEPAFESQKAVFKAALESLFSEMGIGNIQYFFKNKTSIIAGNKTRKIKRIAYED